MVYDIGTTMAYIPSACRRTKEHDKSGFNNFKDIAAELIVFDFCRKKIEERRISRFSQYKNGMENANGIIISPRL
jgi:hypothetical protein